VARPTKDPRQRRANPRQVKFTAAEDRSYRELVKAIAADGPTPLDAHLLLWLVEQECGRRGIPWPWPDEAPVPAVRPQRRPSSALAVAAPMAEAPPDRFGEPDVAAAPAPPPRRGGRRGR